MKVPFMKKIVIILSLGLLIGFVGCKINTTEDNTLSKIAFDVTFDKNNEIELTYTSTKADEICFTAPEGYVSYQWYCDGKEITGLEDKNQNVCRITTDSKTNPFSRAELLPYFTDGKHEILVIVKDSNGVYNSAKATFYVYNK